MNLGVSCSKITQPFSSSSPLNLDLILSLMKFPGNRQPSHYFPRSSRKSRRRGSAAIDEGVFDKSYYVIGLDQLIVDIEVRCEDLELLEHFNITPGESVVVDREKYLQIEKYVREKNFEVSFHAGGAVGNTLCNFSILSGERSFMLGTVPKKIDFNDLTYKYLVDSHPLVSLDELTPVDGHLAHAYTFITPNERSFALSMGCANSFSTASVKAKEEFILNSSIVLLTAYFFRDPEQPIHDAALMLMDIARRNNVPVVLGMGTAALISSHQEKLIDILKNYVSVAAMNLQEATALTRKETALEACQVILDWVDVAVITEGAMGITIGGYADKQHLRKSDIVRDENSEFYEYEYSRLFERVRCEEPVRIFSHAHPYLGGPERISTTNGAGDSVLAALLHDIAANAYHKDRLPKSEKHESKLSEALTYSSLSRITQYGNRVAYQILLKSSPRLEAPLDDDES